MRKAQPVKGISTQGDSPDWEPLLALLGEELTGDFMWMFEVMLETGMKLQAYKHYYTRRYVHLDAKGGAWIYESDGIYRPYSLTRVLTAVFLPLEGLWGVTDEQVERSWEAVDRLESTP